MATIVLLAALGGCGLLGGADLESGTYVGELSCRAIVVDPSGVEGQENYTTAMTLMVDESGALTVNGELIAVGAQVTRSLPNADLAFEVMTITHGWGHVAVTYEPRPTLPGITVEGELVEDYQPRADVVRAFGHADLVVTDVSGESTFQIECSGTLTSE